MLDKILVVVALVFTIILRILQRKTPVRPVEDILTETPVMDAGREEAQEKAEEKFGPRPN